MSQLRLYDYAASANCYKVRLLLALLGTPYERVPVDIFAGETLDDAFAARNPARTTPVLELEPGRYLTESDAILLALAEGTPYLPEDPFARWQAYRWLFFEQADVVPTVAALRFRLATGRLDPAGEDTARRRVASEAVLGVLDGHLATARFAAGEVFTVADIALYAYLHVAGEAGIAMHAFPAVEAWLGRVETQEGFMDDLEPYPANAHVGVSRSIYD